MRMLTLFSTLAGLFVCMFVIAGCNGGPNQTNIELLQDMMDQRALKSQKYDDLRDAPSALVPPENTVPRGFTPYPYPGDALKAEANLKNPLTGELAEKWAARGEDRFKIYCSPCHGFQGKGDGTVAQFMALKPPPLISDKVRNFKDGRIFHIISDGQGLMQTYATQVRSEQDRWAIVNYVRKLQAQAK